MELNSMIRAFVLISLFFGASNSTMAYAPKCTNINIKYEKTVPAFYATITYDDCKYGIITQTARPETPNNFSAKVGSDVKIGPKWTATNYINEKVPDEGMNVLCFGVLGSTGNCTKQPLEPLRPLKPSRPVPVLPIKPSHE